MYKYKNCVYFGESFAKNKLSEGVIYFFCGVIYMGQLYGSQRHGKGVQIDIYSGKINLGEYKYGEMFRKL